MFFSLILLSKRFNKAKLIRKFLLDSATESAIIWMGEWQDALALRQQLTCDPGFSKLSVTPLRWNSSQHSWADIRHCLQGMFSTNLKGQIDQIQLELHQQLSDIKHLTEQKVFQTRHDNLQWLNPKNWFDGLNLWVWIMAALGCLLVLTLICALRCIWRLFAQDCNRDKQIVGFTGLTTTTDFTNKKGGDVGNHPAWFQKLYPLWLRLSQRTWDTKPLRRQSLSP